MGEHAVVYGRPALAAAIDLRLTVRLSPLPGSTVRLDLPSLPHAEETTWDAVRAHARAARESWDEYAREPGPERFRAVRGDDRSHLVKVALGEAAAALGEADPARAPSADRIGAAGRLRLRQLGGHRHRDRRRLSEFPGGGAES